MEKELEHGRRGQKLRWAASALLVLAILGGHVVAAGEPGEEAFAAGDYDEAARVLERHLRDEPQDTGARLRLGWCRYRLGAFEKAVEAFSAVLEATPANEDARIGLAYARLQIGEPNRAAHLFLETLRAMPEHREALEGLVLAGQRPGADPSTLREAIAVARKLVDLDPTDARAQLALLGLESKRGGATERRLRMDADAALPFRVPSRAGRDYLEVRTADGWTPVFLVGFNLGAALPGRFPTEFPEEEATYRSWFSIMESLGANAVRVYTLLPPAFYRALLAHNASKAGAPRIWLLQGVWAELPEDHDFDRPAYVGGMRDEIARVIDAVHGNLILAPRPGHASGLYDTDASGSLLAYVIGREWEPFAVSDFNAMQPGECSWSGSWFRVAEGRAMECWIARILDFAAGHEAARYREQHPLSFSNWPTLDPLLHPTESTHAEEVVIRKRLGAPYVEKLREPPWDHDAVSLDATRILPTSATGAGLFASYHIYPNYPDFMNLDPAYDVSRDAEGPSRYAGYLRALKAYHREQPVLVAEFGISTSRGIAHQQPLGWHHGGVEERDQGKLIARMLRSIAAERYAGGIVFSFMDEWFKGTWCTAPFELPPERRRLWFNAESPEESYGMLANRPGEGQIRVDGDPTDWTGVRPLLAKATPRGEGWGALRELRVAHDEGYLYLLIRTAGGPDPPDFTRVGLRLAVDTYDAGRGERELPPPGAVRLPGGVEFLIQLEGPDRSTIVVTEPYLPAPGAEGTPLASPLRPTGRFVPLWLETNRERFGRDGTRFPALGVDRGVLRYGSLDPESTAFDSRTDVAVGPVTGTLELRLPWSLLNVADPSTRRVLHREGPRSGPLDTTETEGFRFYLLSYDPSLPGEAPLDRLPPRGKIPAPYLWAGWSTPRYRSELKRGAALLEETMEVLSRTAPGTRAEVSDAR